MHVYMHLFLCESPSASPSRLLLVFQHKRNAAAPAALGAAPVAAGRAPPPPTPRASTTSASTTPAFIELGFLPTRARRAQIVGGADTTTIGRNTGGRPGV